jgi:uncharacterized RDD family membrane protein YckC
MDLISISTTQNVNLLTEKAGIGRRILAILLDYLVEVALTIGAFYLLRPLGMGDTVMAIYIVVVGIIWFFYHFFFEILTGGQSLGKMALQIKVVQSSGEGASVYQYFIRALLRPVDMILGLGLFVMAFNPKGQRLGDIAADTIVIQIDKPVRFEELISVELEENYQPLLSRSKIDLLSGKDIELIKRVISETYRTNSYRMMDMLYERVITVLDVKPDVLPKEFLARVVKDYNYYA